jgi:hypothetical protein
METLHAQKLTVRRSPDGAGEFAYGSLPHVALSAAEGDGEWITFTTAEPSGVLEWELFTVAGCAPAGYNGTWYAYEVAGNTIKTYGNYTETLVTPGTLTPETPHGESLARYHYHVPAPGQDPVPVPVLGLAVSLASIEWTILRPAGGDSNSGSFTNYIRYLRAGEQVWERHVSMSASFEIDSASPPNATFACDAAWSEGGTPPDDYSLPLPELPIDEITRDEWCDDRADPKVWLELGNLALNHFEALEPCGVRDA